MQPKLRVLLVDDLIDDLIAFGGYLRLKGCDVRTCGRPASCVELALDFRPHLVILDLQMPGMSGVELARQLKQGELPPFLLVARTGFSDEGRKKLCEQVGFDMVVIKPIATEALDQLLERARRIVGDGAA
jgi:CheY-like chemotaxis protein